MLKSISVTEKVYVLVFELHGSNQFHYMHVRYVRYQLPGIQSPAALMVWPGAQTHILFAVSPIVAQMKLGPAPPGIVVHCESLEQASGAEVTRQRGSRNR